jgi:hypothetical protein
LSHKIYQSLPGGVVVVVVGAGVVVVVKQEATYVYRVPGEGPVAEAEGVNVLPSPELVIALAKLVVGDHATF